MFDLFVVFTIGILGKNNHMLYIYIIIQNEYE